MSIVNYIKESYNELVNEVTWPSKKELANSAIVVLVASLLIALVVFAMDKVIQTIMQAIYGMLY
ncbi:MAG: preprotein translocase subunit SecE [Paludibacteraceae bacterium]|jgi:preprotein translocase subunit SecE|nr:preprotein translocase subunit SecE [Paludibacteraceae bacterium]MEE3483655.1 preprotein translocase subunit SecE [Bacteroidales bacterium]